MVAFICGGINFYFLLSQVALSPCDHAKPIPCTTVLLHLCFAETLAQLKHVMLLLMLSRLLLLLLLLRQGKPFAVFGCGDAVRFKNNFADAIGEVGWLQTFLDES
jgi:hypothetical protein